MDEDQGGTRVTVRFPDELLGRVDDIAKKQYRSRSSVIIEACDFFVNEKPVLEAEAIARESPEYRAILAKLREDLGIPPQPL